MLDSIKRRITPNSSAVDLTQTDEQVAEDRRVKSRRTEDRKLWQAYCSLAAMCIFGFSFFLWYMAATNKQIAQLRQEASAARTVVSKFATEYGLFSTELIRQKSKSVLEVHATFSSLQKEMSTAAAYLGDGFLLTVKHGTFIQRDTELYQANQVHIHYKKLALPVEVVDYVDTSDLSSGEDFEDWAILKVLMPLELTPLAVCVTPAPSYGLPVARIGNDSGDGIKFTFGYISNRRESGMYDSLMPIHQGGSGGPIIRQDGCIVGMSIGMKKASVNFAFIRPITKEMFKKVPHVWSRLAH